MLTRVPLARLEDFATAAFESCGVPTPAARRSAEALCYADAVGMDTHGVANLERIYLSGLRDGAIVADAEPETVRSAGATAVVDAHRALGLGTAPEVVAQAVELSRQSGVAAIAVRNSSHLGSLGWSVLRGAELGTVTLAFCNCGSQRIVPAPGGREPVLGTNPLAIGIPGHDRPPFVLDMSTTVVPTGRIRRAAALGEQLPVGLLADADGRPETDPAALDEGRARVLWLGSQPETGAFKGFGLGLAVDLLSGLLSGGAVGPLGEPGGHDRDVSHLFVTIDVEHFADREAFGSRFDAVVERLLAASGDATLASYPGAREATVRAERDRDGVPISPPVADALRQASESCGLSLDLLEAA